jgi:hypothetical protein
MSFQKYLTFKRLGSHGKVSDLNTKFSSWFDEINSNNINFVLLYEKLAKILSNCGVNNPNKKIDRIYILKEKL